jgi:collagenase-like PrtC family protease
MAVTMRVSLAAVPYFWSREAYRHFYRQVASSPVDIVYLGETICAKRRSMNLQDWLEIAQMLSEQGKQAVLSTLTLIEAESELKYLSRIAAQTDYLIEANDLAAVRVAAEHGNRFVAGCAINIYNSRAFDVLERHGMSRWCAPVELGQRDIEPILAHAQSCGVETEYQVYGRMPLAYSARCFTARHHHLAKDDCRFKCQEDEQGIAVDTQEGGRFARINGIQTQSRKVINLLDSWRELRAAGVDILRVVPVGPIDTIQVLYYLHAQITGQQDSGLRYPTNYEYCDGYWWQQEGMKYSVINDWQ